MKALGGSESSGAALSVEVVIPAHQAEREVASCLEELENAGFHSDEITVVDDGSTDATGDVARAAGVRVIVNSVARGPARARNRGVMASDADIIIFVDADVVVHESARERLLGHFLSDASLTALFGSYDDSPAAQRSVSRYRNLLHHFVHQNGLRDARTFWTGFGAVRRESFLSVGGLDPEWQNIEDVEFGLRLAEAGGRILLDRELLATHLKDWTLSGMLRTDFVGRAVPWTRLLMFRGARTGDLNTSAAHLIAACAILSIAAALLVAVFEPMALIVAVTGAILFVTANLQFLRFLSRRHGTGFVLRSIPLHALHYAAALSGYVWVIVTEVLPYRLRLSGMGRRSRP